MSIRRFLLVVCLLVSAAPLCAQTGHWEGAIKAPEMNVAIEVDLVRDASGALAGTFNNAARNLRGLPLSDVRAEGSEVTFAIKLTGGGVFRGKLSSDGQSIEGVFAMPEMELPFSLTRTGEAKVEQAPRSAAIAKELEGRWRATLVADGTSREVGLRLANHPDGTSTGIIVSSQGAEIPLSSIVQKETSLTFEVKPFGGAFTGTIGPDGIAGTWTQGTFSAPLTFQRP